MDERAHDGNSEFLTSREVKLADYDGFTLNSHVGLKTNIQFAGFAGRYQFICKWSCTWESLDKYFKILIPALEYPLYIGMSK